MSWKGGVGVVEFAVFLEADFPFEEAERIGARLMSLDCLVPGFVPPSVGLLDLGALFYADQVEGLETVLVVDRNLASRMAQLASEGAPRRRDHPTEVAINLMAFAQTMNLDIEPGLAFHELAHREGDLAAQGELSWFRAADRGAAKKWIDVAMRRATTVDLGKVAPVEMLELSTPLNRWNRNYIATLKTAQLSLLGGRRLDSVLGLLDWMIDDFILAAPAFMYAARYFGPRAASAKMFKSLKGQDSEKAILGVRNAAWDVTYLSEFGRLSGLRDSTNRQYVFASADRPLVELASTLFCGPEATEDFPALVEKLEQWWPPKEALRIRNRFFECVEHVGTGRDRVAGLPGDPISEMIDAGEAWIREW